MDLVVVIILVFVVREAFTVHGLQRRIDWLEAQIQALRGELAQRPFDADEEPLPQDGKASVDIPEPEPAFNTPVVPLTDNIIQQADDPPSQPWGSTSAQETEPVTSVPAKMDIESLLGGRWAVWLGALALALGGIFLVRYSIERGYFGPAARIASGLIFSGLLLAAGEYLRRRLPDLRIPAFEQAPVPALLTAVGTMSAFGTFYAAYALYDLLSPGATFVALALVGLGAILAAGLHGPWLAGLGLLGALATPVLVKASAHNLWALVTYLGVVAAAGYVTASLRGWAVIGRASLVGVLMWGVLLLDVGAAQSDPLRLFLLSQLVLAGLAFAWWPYRQLQDGEAFVAGESHGVLGALTALCALVLLRDRGFELPGSPGAVLALMVLAWRLPVVSGAALMAGGLALVQLFAWPPLPASEAGPVLMMPLPDSVQRFSAVAAAFAVGIGGASWLRLKRGAQLPPAVAGLYALAAVCVPLAILVLVWLRIRGFSLAPEFGLVAAGLGLAFSAAAVQFRRGQGSAMGLDVEVFAAGAIAALALGLTMVLDRGYLTVSFALAAAGAAWVTSKGPVQALRIASGVLAGLVLARIAMDPAIMAGNPGTTPLFNWLLFGYGVPMLSFIAASRFLRPGGKDTPQRLMEGMAVLFGALLVTFEIRHFLHGADLLTAHTSHLELGLHLVSGAAIARVLMRLDPLDANPVFRAASTLLALLSSGIAALGLFLAENPALDGGPVEGGPLFNSLIPGYALPAAALGGLYLIMRRRRPAWLVQGVGGLAFGLVFLYVSLSVRRLFHDADISFYSVDTPEAELWTYSAVWLVLGILLLAWGVLRKVRALRLVSACFIVPTILKVFLIDMGGLEGAWRALSFIGLGVALIGIGLVYQRFVFAPSRPDRSESNK